MDDPRGQPQHTSRTLDQHDISALPTQQLHHGGAPQLQGVAAYEREAAVLQDLARRLEGHLWACSEALEQARASYHQLQATVKAMDPNTPTAQRHDLEQARLDMEGYATVMLQIREDYHAFLHQADQYLAAAARLRRERPEDHQTPRSASPRRSHAALQEA